MYLGDRLYQLGAHILHQSHPLTAKIGGGVFGTALSQARINGGCLIVNFSICCFSLSLAIFPDWGSPYMPFYIYIYKDLFCAKSCIFYCWIIPTGIIFSGIFIYSYMFMVFSKYKLEMLVHMTLSFWVEITLFKNNFSVFGSAVVVLTSLGDLIRFSPTVSWVRCVSYFCGHISATIIT